MKRILLSLLVLSALAGCESTPDKAASIEDRNAAKSTQSAQKSAGADTMGTQGFGVGGQQLDASKTDPRKDPSSPLSKRNIYFDFDSFVVKDEYRPVLEAHAAYLTRDRKARIAIQGNADERGSREYNLALGQRRAEAVLKSMSAIGVGEAQMEAVSFGEEKPRSTGKTEQDHAENRRADIVYGDE